jgi:teichuronic acid biosynthesis glycosyltransferase TuaC
MQHRHSCAGPLAERPLRVVSVAIPYPGPRQPAGGLFVHRRLRALARLANVRVINPQPWFPGLRAAPAAPLAPEEPPVERPRMFYLPGLCKGLDGYWLKRCLLPILRRIQADEGPIDLIDAHFEYPEAVGCVLAGQELGLPVFVTIRGLLMRYLATRARRSQCLWALRHAAGVISVAEQLKRDAVRHGILEGNIRVIPNGVDDETFHPGPSAEGRRDVGLDALDAPLVVAVGHPRAVKGHHILLPAFAGFRAKHPGARLAIIGNTEFDAAYTRQLRAQIKELQLDGAATLIGAQPPQQVASWLRAADVLAHPSQTEGCCNAILEALACGLPVVATPVGDNVSFIEATQGGLLVPVGAIAALAEALDQAVRTSWDRPAIAARATGRGWDLVAQEVSAFFRARLGGNGGHAANRLRGEVAWASAV